MKTIATKSIGCLMCHPYDDYPLSGLGGRNRYSFITSPGQQGIPSYEDLIKKDVYLNTHCSKNEDELRMYSNEIMGITMFHTYIDGN